MRAANTPRWLRAARPGSPPIARPGTPIAASGGSPQQVKRWAQISAPLTGAGDAGRTPRRASTSLRGVPQAPLTHSVATPRGGIRGTAGQPVRRFLPSLEGAGAQRGCQTPAPIFLPLPPSAVADPAVHKGIEAWG